MNPFFPPQYFLLKPHPPCLQLPNDVSFPLLDLIKFRSLVFSASKAKKRTPELKKCLLAMLKALERLFCKSYYDFVSLFELFLSYLKGIFCRQMMSGVFLRIYCRIFPF